MARPATFRSIRTVGDLKAVLSAFPEDIEVHVSFTPMQGDGTYSGEIDADAIVHQVADSSGDRYVVIDVHQTFGDKFREFSL